MGVLDAIIRKKPFVGPETVNADFYSDAVDISKAEGKFSLQLIYNGGSSVNMNLFLEVSNDGTNFSQINGSGQNITDNEGSHIWDVTESGAVFCRVYIQVVAGSIDLQSIDFTAKRRH